MPESPRFFDPKTLSKLGNLDLIARQVVEGYITGLHKSPYQAFAVEFAQHREYVPGDEIKHVDWKVWARSDRYYIKQYEEETNLRSLLLLDASGSMAYAGKAAAKHDGKAVSKFHYAQFLAATLAHLMIGQRDAVGLATLDTHLRRYIPARSRTSHLQAILQELSATETGGETTLAPILHDLAERIRRRGLVILISDLFDDVDPLLEALHHFRYRKHEVLLLHVMAEEELSFPFDKWSRFRNLELSGHWVNVDPVTVRAAYLEQVRAHVDRLRRGAGQMKIDYVQMTTAQSFDAALSGYLARRMARRR